MAVCSTSTLTSLLSVVILVGVHGYPDGAPLKTCDSGNVIHWNRHINASYEPLPAAGNPFRFIPSTKYYTPGSFLKVTVGENSSNIDEYKVEGFFLQARVVSDEEPCGEFDENSLPPLTKLRPCTSDNDAVTHTDRSEKSKLAFTWKAPDQCVGDIRFIGSVAMGHSKFFNDMNSVRLSCAAVPTVPTPTIVVIVLAIVMISIVLSVIIICWKKEGPPSRKWFCKDERQYSFTKMV